MRELIDFILHFDEHLAGFITSYGAWTYGILFLIILCETGLVIMPFLPGDSLLFAAGALAARLPDALNIWLLFGLLSLAAIVGDTLNYSLGRAFGLKVFSWNLPFVKQEYLERTQQFYTTYGAKTIVLARFVPIVRTFAPFVAGVGKMDYRTFITYNIIGGLAWVAICLGAGYLFGGLPIVKDNFELVVLGIIAVSVLPMIVELIKARRASAPATARKAS